MNYKVDSPAYRFVMESNSIEGITREPTIEEMSEYKRFMELEEITLADLQTFVETYQPGARLRLRVGCDVRVGNHIPPRGGRHIQTKLLSILETINTTGRYNSYIAWITHMQYENLHPFTDGNGRSGRMLWAWQMMLYSEIGFLHKFYYQTLSYGRKEED